jgi:hypothetical protein
MTSQATSTAAPGTASAISAALSVFAYPSAAEVLGRSGTVIILAGGRPAVKAAGIIREVTSAGGR